MDRIHIPDGLMNHRMRVPCQACMAPMDTHDCLTILHTPHYQQNIGVTCRRCGRHYTFVFEHDHVTPKGKHTA